MSIDHSFSRRLSSAVLEHADAKLDYWLTWLGARPTYVLGHNPAPLRRLEHDLYASLDLLSRLQLIAAAQQGQTDVERLYRQTCDQLYALAAFVGQVRTAWGGSSEVTRRALKQLAESRTLLRQFHAALVPAVQEPQPEVRDVDDEPVPDEVTSSTQLLTNS